MGETTSSDERPRPAREPRVFDRVPVRMTQIDGGKVASGETTAFSAAGSGVRIKVSKGGLPEAGEKYQVEFLSDKYSFLPLEGIVIGREAAFDNARFDAFIRGDTETLVVDMDAILSGRNRNARIPLADGDRVIVGKMFFSSVRDFFNTVNPMANTALNFKDLSDALQNKK